jgi:sugar phosphate isomerase/epimerase
MPSPPIAVSTWSLHRALGVRTPNAPGNDAFVAEPAWGDGRIALADLPAEIARNGIGAMQICHFHLASRDPAYLGEVSAAARDAGVAISTLLIDDGDVTHPDDGDRDRDWIGRWIEAAAHLGAPAARVIAGKQKPARETLDRSVSALRELARRGREWDVRIITENWHDLLAGPNEVAYVLDRLDGAVGFLADFGNWQGPSKYADLAAVLGRAEDTHAKASFGDGLEIDGEDFGRCLAAADRAGYGGPYTLIYEGRDDDEWRAVAIERDFVRDHFSHEERAIGLT